MDHQPFNIEIIEVSRERTRRMQCLVDQNTTIAAVLNQAAVQAFFKPLHLQTMRLGCFGQTRTLADVLQPGDRIELLEPLRIDPKVARRLRAKKKG